MAFGVSGVDPALRGGVEHPERVVEAVLHSACFRAYKFGFEMGFMIENLSSRLCVGFRACCESRDSHQVVLVGLRVSGPYGVEKSMA